MAIEGEIVTTLQVSIGSASRTHNKWVRTSRSWEICDDRLRDLLPCSTTSCPVHPRSDVDTRSPTITPVPTEGHVFRPRWIAVAAASVVLIGGSAFAMERLTNDPPRQDQRRRCLSLKPRTCLEDHAADLDDDRTG